MPNGTPNFLLIWGDDIGITNLSCYSDGLMGYRTANIDRIANEGMRFTDSYGEQSCTAGGEQSCTAGGEQSCTAGGEQSCTAGRAAFISGQSSSVDRVCTAPA
jgi:hypothetical protein